MRGGRIVLALSFLAGAAPLAADQGVAGWTLADNEVSASIELAGGIGADFTLHFEQVLGLDAESLGLSAELISPTALVGRLPAGVSLPAAFPVVVKIAPPRNGPLGFSGLATLELHTHNLTLVANSPLRLFRAQFGGAFRDVTESMGTGSYRVRGSTGGFSEFLIVADTRAIDSVIASKYTALQSLLDADDSIPDAVAAALQGRLDASLSAYRVRSYAAAADQIDELSSLIEAQSGTAIANVWRSSRDLVNSAGELRAACDTLRFSLNLRASSGPL